MSGHSRWSTIKRKKGAADAKKGKIFTKLIRELTVAAKQGGGSPDLNPRLRTAILGAKAQNMPSDNIDRAIKKGTGELEGVTYDEMTYEAFGPGGIALVIDVLTDNKQRTVAEVRNLLSKNGGNLGETGSVGWNFELKGVLSISKSLISEEKLTELAIESGAEDIRDAGTSYEVVTEPKTFEAVKESLEKHGLKLESAELTKLPKTLIQLDKKEAEQLLKLIDLLEDNDDVQNVYSNSDISSEISESLGN